jgi:hypothetical protein
MQYGEVVSTINNLIPEMVKTGDPEAVLLKHAHENALAPAVLQRMGQAFNIGTALQGMMGEDRGKTIPLLDVDVMLDKYAAWPASDLPAVLLEPQTKHSAIPDLIRCMAGVNVTFTDPDEMPKAASEVDSSDLLARYDVQEQQISDLAYELCKSAEVLMSDLTAKGYVSIDERNSKFKIREVESGSIRHFGDMAKTAFDWFEGHAKFKCGAGCLRAEQQDVEMYKLAHNWSGCGEAADAMVEVFGRTLAARAERDALLKEAAEAGLTEDMLFDKLAVKLYQGKPVKTPPQKKTDPDVLPLGDNPEKLDAGGTDPVSPHRPPVASGRTRPGSQPLTVYLDHPDESPDTDREGLDVPVGDAVKKILDLLGKPLGIAGGEATKWLTNPRQNKSQIKVDVGARNVEQEHALQTLILTDPVISKADPDQVAEIYETIRRGSPDIATDKNLLRFQLREALQYGGVPPDAYKQLLDITKLRDSHTQNERKLDTELYNKPRR